MTDLPIALIKEHDQTRADGLNQETVHEYAEAMRSGDIFPPVTVFFDGTDHWLAEGFHRTEAARKAGREKIPDVRNGTARDAILFGIGSNATHGLRRTQADKRRAVERLLADPEWARWSDRKIGEVARVDHKTVAKVRREMSGEIPTGKTLGGEFPTPVGKTNGGGTSMLTQVLGTIPDYVLLQECRRRGLVRAEDEL